MKLICKATGVTVEAAEEVAKKLIGKGFEEVKPAAKRTPKPKE